jgi:hypothetical protein
VCPFMFILKFPSVTAVLMATLIASLSKGLNSENVVKIRSVISSFSGTFIPINDSCPFQLFEYIVKVGVPSHNSFGLSVTDRRLNRMSNRHLSAATTRRPWGIRSSAPQVAPGALGFLD